MLWFRSFQFRKIYENQNSEFEQWIKTENRVYRVSLQQDLTGDFDSEYQKKELRPETSKIDADAKD